MSPKVNDEIPVAYTAHNLGAADEHVATTLCGSCFYNWHYIEGIWK
jgi:hypothetical protein